MLQGTLGPGGVDRSCGTEMLLAIGSWVGGKVLVILQLYLGLSPHPVTVTIRIVTFLVGNPYKPSFVTATGRGEYPNYTFGRIFSLPVGISLMNQNFQRCRKPINHIFAVYSVVWFHVVHFCS